MKNIKKIVKNIQNILIKNGDPEKSKFIKSYMKEVIESRGIQSKPLDILFKDLYINNLKDSDKETHLNVGLELLRSDFIED